MDKEFQEFLNKEIAYSHIDTNKKIKLLNEIKNVFIKDKKLLEEITNIDLKKWRKKIDLDKFIEIVDAYKQGANGSKTSENVQQIKYIEKMVVSFYGNPYVTLNMCIQEIIYQKQLLLETGEFMLATNEFIVKMINQILEENHLQKLLIHCIELLDKKSIIEKEIKTIIIGAIQKKAEYLGKYKYVPYNEYILYCLDEELEELNRSIYDYASDNFFEVEVLDEEDIEEAIRIINLKKDCIAVILTKDRNLQNVFKEKIKNKLYINENPFSKEEMNIPLDCLK